MQAPPEPDGPSGVEEDVGAALLRGEIGLSGEDAREQIALERRIYDVINLVSDAFPDQYSGYEI